MNEKSYKKLNSSQKYNIAKLNKASRFASMSKSNNATLEDDLNYYTWPMLHDAYTGELNYLGRRVEAEKIRRAMR